MKNAEEGGHSCERKEGLRDRKYENGGGGPNELATAVVKPAQKLDN